MDNHEQLQDTQDAAAYWDSVAAEVEFLVGRCHIPRNLAWQLAVMEQQTSAMRELTCALYDWDDDEDGEDGGGGDGDDDLPEIDRIIRAQHL